MLRFVFEINQEWNHINWGVIPKLVKRLVLSITLSELQLIIYGSHFLKIDINLR